MKWLLGGMEVNNGECPGPFNCDLGLEAWLYDSKTTVLAIKASPLVFSVSTWVVPPHPSCFSALSRLRAPVVCPREELVLSPSISRFGGQGVVSKLVSEVPLCYIKFKAIRVKSFETECLSE